ncbi:MAG: S-methyl-5'-thioadenosine phosphorylase [Thermodesulfobacteriota bacterium]
MDDKIQLGIIGGSGLYSMQELSDITAVSLDTPFGPTSDDYIIGTLEGVRVAFLPRHGNGHRLIPTEINFKANIYGFKQLGVSRIISVTAVGSLKEDIHPLDIVIPDQFYDHTKHRESTFFGKGLAAHIAYADPFCCDLAALIHESAVETGSTAHKGGTLICIEGPAFSTRAESNLYRQWGMDIIGMTIVQEAKLSREAEICYAAMALVTDDDCWHEEETDVTAATVVENLENNIAHAKRIIRNTVPKIPPARECTCANALEKAIVTAAEKIPSEIRRDLALLLDKYLP